jgi:hypothetical protein
MRNEIFYIVLKHKMIYYQATFEYELCDIKVIMMKAAISCINTYSMQPLQNCIT